MRPRIDKSAEVPLYQQLAADIRARVESGELAAGERLPTVREQAALTGISAGTIRHAYDHLTREGVLQMVQGKGTFVCARIPEVSREKQAMDAIEEMFDSMDRLGFSTREAGMFIDLALRNREAEVNLIPVALVDCNPEALDEAAQQLSVLPGIELSEYLLDDIRHSPGELLGGYSLIITTQTHYHELCALLGERASAIDKVVLSPSQSTVVALARIEAGSCVRIFCKTPRFAQIIRDGMRAIPHLRAGSVETLLAGAGQSLEDFLSPAQTLIVAPDYLSYAELDDQRVLRSFAAAGGQIIPYHHQLDRGSCMYIEDRVRALGSR